MVGAEGLSSVCSRPLSTLSVPSASEGPLVRSKFLELSVSPSVSTLLVFPVRLSLVPICLPFALLAPHHRIQPCLPPPPPLDPVLWELRPRPTLAAPCRLFFSTTGLRPGYPLGLASRAWNPVRPSRRGASSSLALFFHSVSFSPSVSGLGVAPDSTIPPLPSYPCPPSSGGPFSIQMLPL